MERWSGVLRVPVHPNSRTFHRVGASLCLSPETKMLCERRFKVWLHSSCSFSQPKTFILGFSKGGTVLNQIVTELGFSNLGSNVNSLDVGSEDIYVVPKTKEDILNSISDIHYRISKRLMQGAPQLRFILHGTPRQWSDW
ncbi:hypothetical protein PHAVU_011G167200 [Phaseolus vulgaris]|uniref:Uncharacterized protein n=1 Tax=Phaseolus vulgaris TaxID=3885 RepID=V7AMC7_PHAVU|nr:hypothetical protein PHAVU_011G167200g [Phaseolus vulgaris]ESW05281.1 hypothetical protein PHAVU_011G167200g [Phaseolus vulgaris]